MKISTMDALDCILLRTKFLPV